LILSSNIWWGVKITKFVIMQFPFRDFSLRPKHSHKIIVVITVLLLLLYQTFSSDYCYYYCIIITFIPNILIRLLLLLLYYYYCYTKHSHQIIVVITVLLLLLYRYSAFMVSYILKATPSDSCVSADNAICNVTNIFNKDYISLTDIL
jgi:hypothetical protein